MRFSERIKQFLVGRYGGDSLNTVLSVISLISFFAGMLVRSLSKESVAGTVIGWVLYLAAMGLLGLTVFRTFSKNLTARRAEYEWYRSHILVPITRKRNEARTKRAQAATHKFFKCPGCGQTVRVPKGKGKIRITCPKCGKVFVKKT